MLPWFNAMLTHAHHGIHNAIFHRTHLAQCPHAAIPIFVAELDKIFNQLHIAKQALQQRMAAAAAAAAGLVVLGVCAVAYLLVTYFVKT